MCSKEIWASKYLQVILTIQFIYFMTPMIVMLKNLSCDASKWVETKLSWIGIVCKWRFLALEITDTFESLTVLRNHSRPLKGGLQPQTVVGRAVVLLNIRKDIGGPILGVWDVLSSPAPPVAGGEDGPCEMHIFTESWVWACMWKTICEKLINTIYSEK